MNAQAAARVIVHPAKILRPDAGAAVMPCSVCTAAVDLADMRWLPNPGGGLRQVGCKPCARLASYMVDVSGARS